MKKVLLLIACLLVAGSMSAQKVSVEDAKDAARLYLGEKVTRSGTDGLRLAHTQLSLDGSNTEDVYIFNNGDDGGFVIVAGDMRASSLIIGHSDSGTFDAKSIPANMNWWLNEYARQIDFLRNNVAEVNPTRTKAGIRASQATVKVSPLLGSMWNQNTPYNNLAPTAGKSHCPSGCVATAMAQIMYFHKWPKTGKGKHTNKNNTKMTVDFSKSAYKWDKMKDTYRQGSYTQEQADAVAKLMYDCGVSVDMSYNIDGSGAMSEDVTNALTSYFDYSSSAKFITRDKQTDWDDIIVKELEAKRPVYYSGVDVEDGGHAFVADGYEIDGGKILFHINWGWGGAYNCYCLSKIMDQKGTDLKFNLSQDIVIGIKPNNNKVKSGSLYYNLVSETEAQVTFADNSTDYSGDITVPSTVSINGKTYSVTSINSSAFSGCTGVTSVTIPTCITSIGGSAFAGCTGLKTIRVNWTGNIPEVSMGAFSDDVYNNVVLIVPDGMVESYSGRLPWMLFGTVKDSKGASVEYSGWTPFESGKGLYTYSQFLQGDDSLEVIIRSSKTDANKCIIQFKNWFYENPLIINYDKKTNKCQVPEQSTGFGVTYTYKNEKGDTITATNLVYVADLPTYQGRPDLADVYPSTYNPNKGIFSLFLAYYVPEGTFGYGTETMQMAGTYQSLGIEIASATTIQEKADGSGTQKFTIKCEADVAKFKYAFVEGGIMKDSIKVIAQGMADGTVESKTKSVGMANIASVTYPKPGKYTFVVISVDADGNYFGDFAYVNVTYLSSKDWKDVAKGTYTYSLYFKSEDSDLTLSRSVSDPSMWKISNLFGTVDFVFNLDESADTISFEPTFTGATHKTYGDVYIANTHDYFEGPEDEEEMKLYGDASRFDRATDTFKFSVVYCVQAGYFGDCVGVETFKVPGLATLVQTPSVVRSLELGVRSGSYNLNGQVVGDSYKGIVIKDGKKAFRR